MNYEICYIDPCTAYTVISDRTRSALEKSNTIGCDRNLTNSWYRFDGGKNSQVIQTTCIEGLPKCGTLGPGWMRGQHPASNYYINLNQIIILIATSSFLAS